MPNRISNADSRQSSQRASTDAGPAFLNAVDRIGLGTDNPTIERLAADLSAKLQKAGVRNTGWVKEMLFQMRGTHEGVPGDRARFVANVNKAAQLGVIGPKGRAQLLAKVGAAADAQDNRSRLENGVFGARPQSKPRKSDKFELDTLLGASKVEIFKPMATSTKAVTTVEKKADIPTPKLDATIDGLGKALKAMPDGPIKQSLTTVKSSLELARTAQKNGDTTAYLKAIGNLSSDMFKTVGSIVKRFGQDGELAAQAAEQLGKVAGVIGKGVKGLGAIEDLSKVLRGRTLGGAEVTKAQRADAAVNLVTTFLPGPVGTGVSVSKAALEWCYNHIGVPAKEAMTTYGLNRLFGGKSPEQLKAQIRNLPVDDPKKAQWALYQLYAKTFPNTSSGFSQATASSLWQQFLARETQGNNQQMELLNQHKNTKPGENPVIDELRTTMAKRYQAAALRFIDEQVRDAKGSWGV